MVTISYSWNILSAVSPVNAGTAGPQVADGLAVLSDGSFLTTFLGQVTGSPTFSFVNAHALSATGVLAAGGDLVASSYNPGSAFSSDAAGLTNGNYAVAYDTTLSGGSPGPAKVDLYDGSGTLIVSTDIGTGLQNVDVAALSGGAFVVAAETTQGVPSFGVQFTLFDAAGVKGTTVLVDGAVGSALSPQITQLTNGNFAIAYAKLRPGGAAEFDLAVQVYTAAGVKVGSTTTLAIGVDSTPTEAVALSDGGFAVAYVNTTTAGGDDDINLSVFNANGALRTTVHANETAGGTSQAGVQRDATVTQLQNGFVLVGWTDVATDATQYSIWSPTGTFVSRGTWAGSTRDLILAANTNGVVTGVVTDLAGDGDGTGIASSSRTLQRNAVGDGADDVITGDALQDSLNGGGGNDRLIGAGGRDTLIGGNGNDRLDGGAGDDSVDGGENDDLIYGSAGADTIVGGNGFDTVAFAFSTAVRVNLTDPGQNTGDAAGDSYSGVEAFSGGSGNDTMIGDGGANRFLGQDGNDSLSGLGGADLLFGGNGADRLEGGTGDDTLVGGVGADVLIGGDNIDTVSYASAAAGLTLSLIAPGVNTGEAAGDTYSGIENIVGSGLADRLYATNGANRIDSGGGNDVMACYDGADTVNAGDGNDTIFGQGGADRLEGGNGNDVFYGGTGGDQYIGGADTDKVSYVQSGVGLLISLLTPASNTGEAAGDTYSSIEQVVGSNHNDTMYGDNFVNFLNGNGGDDTINGGGANDTVAGWVGNDVLYGAAGSDRLDGGAGNDILVGGTQGDVLVGGSGIDTVSYSSAATGLTANLTTAAANTGDAAGDTYYSIENLIGSVLNDILTGNGVANQITGGNGNDALDGLAGNDTLSGGAGTDSLTGGLGVDRLTGGADADRFIFANATSGIDTITDFVAGTDKIQLNKAGFANIQSLVDGVTFFSFAASPTTASPTLIYNSAGGTLSFDADGNGAGAAVVFAILPGAAAISASDFLLV